MEIKSEEKRGIYLLKEGQKGLIHIIFSKIGLMVLLLLIQIVFMVGLFLKFGEFLPHIMGLTVLFIIVMVLYLLNSSMEPDVKITWLVIFIILPIFGTLLYIYTQAELGQRALKLRLKQLADSTRNSIPQSQQTWEKLQQESPETASLAHYIQSTGCYPIYDKTAVTYFPMGEDKFEELLKQLEKAEHFIFLEYFIVNEGVMWGQILEILAKKVKEGVEVRVMYDGTCEFSTLPHDYPKRLQKLGIQCRMYAPITPFVSTHYNYRDHRKILVIDGHTAFTGGVNLADEYINHIEKYGHWKDTAVMLKGEAVKSFTLMFLQLWNMGTKEPDFEKYLAYPACPDQNARGYVIPYGDCPLDKDKVGERVYMDILNRAQNYVHIMSPYLILDSEMEAALKFAAERGVDVRIILPGIPDKTAPYSLAKTHYSSLLRSGVKIYEYTPGFVHAKVFVCDDIKAVVGTINLDYRSLYHHFECAAYLYNTDCIPEIEQDFQKTMEKCRTVTKETIKNEKWSMKLLGCVMKVLAPLM